MKEYKPSTDGEKPVNIEKISCAVRDALLGDYSDWSIDATCSDMSGNFGEPLMLTRWAKENLRLEERRHPGPGGVDVKKCEHYFWTVIDEGGN